MLSHREKQKRLQRQKEARRLARREKIYLRHIIVEKDGVDREYARLYQENRYKKSSLAENKKRVKKVAKRQQKRHSIVLEGEIDIYKRRNWQNLVKRCTELRNVSKSIFIDLKSVAKIYAAGMLMLFAEVYRLKEVEKQNISGNYPTNEKVEKVLQHIGFLRLLGRPDRIPAKNITEEDIRTWHVAQGQQVDGEQVNDFIDHITEIDKKKQAKLYISIKEVIANCAEHAYNSVADQALNPSHFWIMFGRVDEENNLTIVIGDLGMGIPKTIRKYPGFREFVQILRVAHKLSSHSRLIEIAAKIGETGVHHGRGHRGRGLDQAIKGIVSVNGQVKIYSLKGMTTFDSKPRVDRWDLKKGGRGTIIQFSVPVQDLKAKTNDNENEH